MADMGQRNADRIIDLGGAGEGRIEILPIERPYQLEADLARNLPVKLAPGEFSGGLAAHMDREGRRRLMKELLGVIVGEDDPEIGLQAAQPSADLARAPPTVPAI